MTTLGVVFRPQLPPERLRSVAKIADDSGLAELWLWEDCFCESGIASAAAALAWTERVTVGVGLLPVPLRNVAMTAMEAATLYRLFPDRVTLAVGHGVQRWMGQTGARVDSPVTLLREYLVALRALLRGERVTTNGRYVTLDDVALEWPPSYVPQILSGATGPHTLRLSGEAADGSVLDSINPPDGVRQAIKLIDEGRARGGRTDRHRIVVYLYAATGDGAQDRLRAMLAGRGENTDLGVAGDARAIAAAVRELADAGADTVVLVPTPDEPDIEGLVRLAAEEVQPLVVTTVSSSGVDHAASG
ncbi:LLM class flavin-dependent oxidoreductase [Actinocrispum wychmicini]|uniref:Alkanesulfonate monooxygenase SsuD/methylene tetrahydromethanopterin reductase-like flavin-dependent oxidoreductase (Luciferase family) n=1 Tax=Actinocrispum wychmicini TaxID=1213861 RepID=A0A4R2IU26_9PSEU|nr:LLM class flavin-dependent oxidoreductase [Actinocrispum wychmicini]TCO48162.1 alkanesulfonate monooxygenase SsuD/methylene tetrahydromethanopterin reductase-like flavin-dependent oxidoreductase (luciferase family) [Actinocrispum wychmicini]